jgi:hypothetical protein
MYRISDRAGTLVLTVDTVADAIREIDRLAGRNIGRYIVYTAIPASTRRYGRDRASAYVATNRDSPARVDHGVRGFTVERVR